MREYITGGKGLFGETRERGSEVMSRGQKTKKERKSSFISEFFDKKARNIFCRTPYAIEQIFEQVFSRKL